MAEERRPEDFEKEECYAHTTQKEGIYLYSSIRPRGVGKFSVLPARVKEDAKVMSFEWPINLM